MLEEPAAILVMVTLAALLIVAEAALPTVGIAGSLALILSVGAVVGLERQDATWWPLLGPALAVVVWCVMVARRLRPGLGQAAAAGLFLGGSVTFGVMAHDAVGVVIGGLAAVALAAAFPSLHGAAQRLLEGPTRVGMESLVGTRGDVVSWDGRAGAVVVAGTRWNATSSQPVVVGDPVTVVSFSAMTLDVAPISELNG